MKTELRSRARSFMEGLELGHFVAAGIFAFLVWGLVIAHSLYTSQGGATAAQPAQDTDTRHADPLPRQASIDSDAARWGVAGFRQPEAFLRWLRRFQGWVADDDRDAVVAAVEFPTHSIESEAALRARYEQYFSEPVRQAVAGLDEAEIFKNYQGAMIHHGTLWFRETDAGYRVVAINPDAAE